MPRRCTVLGLAVLISACGAETAAPSGLLSPDAGSATPAATRSGAPETAGPTAASPSGSPDHAAGWEMTATFNAGPATSYVTSVVAWRGGFLAFGSSWESEFRVGAELPAMWASAHGEAWEAKPIDLGMQDVTLTGVAERADGRLLLVGTVPGVGGGVTDASVNPANVAWTSQDAANWERVELPVSDSARLDSLAHGPKGFMLSALTPYTEFDPDADQTPGELWFSADGIEWRKTYEGAAGVVAGEDGFVAIQSALAAGPNSVIASADGISWVPSDVVSAPLFDVASLGGDWLAVGYSGDPATVSVLHSPNGLDWEVVLDVNDLTGPDGPKTGRGLNEAAINEVFLTGGAENAFLMLGDNHCCAQVGWTYGVWETTDGVTWAQAIDEGAHVSSVAAGADVTVLGGHLGRGDAATFWIGN